MLLPLADGVQRTCPSVCSCPEHGIQHDLASCTSVLLGPTTCKKSHMPPAMDKKATCSKSAASTASLQNTCQVVIKSATSADPMPDVVKDLKKLVKAGAKTLKAEVAAELKKKNSEERKLEKTVEACMKMASTKNEKEWPAMHFCGSYADNMNTLGYPVTYQSFFHRFSTVGSGGLDLESGIFTAGWPGTYQVSWSFWNGDDGGSIFILIAYNKI